jgi:hypothetical protein
MAASILRDLVRLKIRNTDPTMQVFAWHGQCMGRFVSWQDSSELFRKASGGDEDAGERAAALRKSMRPGGPLENRGDFLVIDDISREKRTEFNLGELQRILRHRREWGWTTILTTNHDPDEWHQVYDDAFASFLSRSFIPVGFSA